MILLILVPDSLNGYTAAALIAFDDNLREVYSRIVLICRHIDLSETCIEFFLENSFA